MQEFCDKCRLICNRALSACAVLAWAACETAPPCQLLLRQPDKWVTDGKRQLGSSATFFACIFLSASIDGYVGYARRALHLAPIHPPAAFGSADAPPRTAYRALLRDHNRQLVATWRNAESVTGLCAPSPRSLKSSSHRDRAGRASTSAGVTGCCRLHGPASGRGTCVLERQLRHLHGLRHLCPDAGRFGSRLVPKNRGLSQSCAVWGANRPCPRRSIGPRSFTS